MKTIYTTLPIYDRIEKQCFQRGRHAGNDKPIPIICPRHRLPSFEWNVENDSPGELSNIELLNKDYTDAEVTVATDWISHTGFDTFTHALLEITDAQNAAGVCAAYTETFTANIGDQIRIQGTFALVDGVAPNIYLTSAYFPVLIVGYNDIILPVTLQGINKVNLYTLGHSDYTFTGVTITKILNSINITSYFNTTASYIQTGGGAGWAEGVAYDTFTSVNKDITHAQVAAAAGEVYAQNVVAVGSVPVNLVTGDVIRIEAILTLTGHAPKICLRNTGTGATISNIVTLAAGINYICLKATATLATGWAIKIYNTTGETTHYSCIFEAGQKSVIPILFTSLTDDYFQYKGETLGTLLTDGEYSLKLNTAAGYIYYSDWFKVDCVYENLLTLLLKDIYTTFDVSGTSVTSAISAGVEYSSSNAFNVINGEIITVIFYLTLTGAELPTINLANTGWTLGVHEHTVIGLNVWNLTATWTGDAQLRFYNSIASSFSTSEIIVIRQYSEKYLTINFSNVCDLGDILYHDGFTQTLWLESETMETTFPQEEEGMKNGEGRFVRTFARQIKKYLARTKEIPDFMVDVFNRMKLHDTIELIDLVGDVHDVYNLEVEHEWLYDDKYYAKSDLTFDFDEAVIVTGCCNNIT